MIKFHVAVPTYNSAAYVGRCLAGLLELQPGPFSLHVHVQDGASTDGTLDVVAAWRRRVEGGEVPDHDRRRLTVASGRDGGLYDAVTRGFEGVGADPDTVMTWIGSDDVLLPGALATVADLLGHFQEVRWITGQPQVVNHQGAWHTGYRTAGFSRRDFRLGLHDGRGLWFVMQEGTFWRASLYHQAGGLRRDLRLAGDFDLWRRFARTDDLVTWSAPLALWSQRPGQTSGDLAAYYREVDRSLADDPEPRSLEVLLGGDGLDCRFRRRLVERYPGQDYVEREEPLSFEPVEGLGGVERPGPGDGGLRPFVRCAARRARLRISLLEADATYEVGLRLRADRAGLPLTIRAGRTVLFEGPLGRHGAGQPEVVTVRHRFPERLPVLTLEPGLEPGAPGPGLLARLRGARRGAEGIPGLRVEDVAIRRLPSPETP